MFLKEMYSLMLHISFEYKLNLFKFRNLRENLKLLKKYETTDTFSRSFDEVKPLKYFCPN